MTGDPLTRLELEGLAAEADYGFSKALVAEILRTALAYEEKAAKWDTYVRQNRAAQARWREAHPDRKPAKPRTRK
jgi:hypothetical protein